MAKLSGTDKIKLESYEKLNVSAKEWVDKLEKVKLLIVSAEFDNRPITTQELRGAISWESGKDYRCGVTGK